MREHGGVSLGNPKPIALLLQFIFISVQLFLSPGKGATRNAERKTARLRRGERHLSKYILRFLKQTTHLGNQGTQRLQLFLPFPSGASDYHTIYFNNRHLERVTIHSLIRFLLHTICVLTNLSLEDLCFVCCSVDGQSVF